MIHSAISLELSISFQEVMVTIYGLFYSAKATREVLPLHSVWIGLD